MLCLLQGMIFLHNISKGVSIIHRDLAARNVLITNEPHTAKITDFGLARTLSDKDYYRCSHSSILPFLWWANNQVNFIDVNSFLLCRRMESGSLNASYIFVLIQVCSRVHEFWQVHQSIRCLELCSRYMGDVLRRSKALHQICSD